MKTYYFYFISFKFPTGFGNCEFKLNNKISNMEHIKEIEARIRKDKNITGVSIENFIFLRAAKE